MILLLFLIFRVAGATCPCDGITLEGSDQEHCWQIQSRADSSWSAGDDACVAVGGHLGHPNNQNYDSILSYVQKTSSLPVLTGIVAGNTEIPVIGEMCQTNTFYQVINNTTALFGNSPTSSSTCSYITSSSSELMFDSCSISANVLCDRPLEKQDYCSIVANCTSTTTSFYSSTTASSSTGSSSTPVTSTTLNSSISSTKASSLATGGSSSASTSTVSDGSGSGGGTGATTTCNCGSGSNGVATTTVASCSEQKGCLKHQWKIFGMCVDWRAMLALLIIGLLLFLCCLVCHCCMHACMFCTTDKNKERTFSVRKDFLKLKCFFFIVNDPILPNRTVVAPIPIAASKNLDYDIEKSEAVILPPPAVQPEPVFITVPEKHESVYGFHTKEIIHVLPERPKTREIGTMTDPMEPSTPKVLPLVAPVPVIKRKKTVKKPKKMFIPATADPMDSIEEDVAAEIPLEIPDSPGARSVAPLGDVADPAPMIPLNFARNAKPIMPEPKSHDDIKTPSEKNFAPKKPNNGDSNEEFDPSGLRSPPIPAGNPGNPNDKTPKRMTFSPIADESDEESGARIPSPPRERKDPGRRPGNDSAANLTPNPPSKPESESRPTLKNQRLNELPSPTPEQKAPAPSKSPSSGGSSNPFANLGGPSPAPENGGAGRGPPGDDVGMRAARGRLGGAVRGGGGGGEAPNGWKPWAKGGARR